MLKIILICCEILFFVIFIYYAIANYFAGGYQQFSIKRFLCQKTINFETESPLQLLLYALICVGGAILFYVTL